jgi:hypothetical protein
MGHFFYLSSYKRLVIFSYWTLGFFDTDFAERFLSDDCIFIRSPSTGHLTKMQEV